jgi:hypothetical protein
VELNMTTLTFEPLIPAALWLTLAVAALALLAWYGWSRPRGLSRRRWAGIVALMGLGLFLVLALLLNPTWIEPVPPPEGKPHLTILVDATGSMTTADAADGKSRYQAAVGLARGCLEQLGDRYDVQVAAFAGSVRPTDVADLEKRLPDGTITDIAAALTESLAAQRAAGQAVILLSDGIHNGPGGTPRVLDAVRVARAMASPIYTHTLGGDPKVQDLAVELRSPQEVAFMGQKVSVPVTLRQRGFAGAKATLVISEPAGPNTQAFIDALLAAGLPKDDPSIKKARAGIEIDRRQVTLTKETVEVTFQVGQDKPGVYRYEVRAEPLPGEVSLSNNSATLMVRVVDKPVRVLLLEGKPYWDAKFLMRTLIADASIELDSVVRLSDSRFLRRTFSHKLGEPPAASAQEEWKIISDFTGPLAEGETLKSYQVVVLGRDADAFLTDAVLTQLRTWIAREGGCLVCARGQPMAQVNQRLAQLLPVNWSPARESRFRVSVTERGRDLHWLQVRETPGAELAQLPTLATVSHVESPRPVAIVLATSRSQATGTEEPAVTYQSYGTGRVVVIEGAGMWRWAFLPPQQQQHDDVYRSLWHGLLRWLVASGDLLPGQKMALRSDRVRFDPAEQATATLLLREEGDRVQVPRIELRGDGGQPRTFAPAALGEEPGAFRVVFGALPEGRYQIRVADTPENDATTSAAFDVRSAFEEQLDLKARPDLMERIARESGGAVLEGATIQGMIEQFQEHRERSRPVQVQRLSAWDRWWVLVAIIGLWGTAWVVRRSGGLI